MSLPRIFAIGLAIVLPIILLVVGIGSFVVLGQMKPPPEEKERGPKGLVVFTEPVAKQNISLSIEAQGQAKPRREVDLSPQVGGRVTFVSENLVNGGFVKKGELLVRIEDADYKLAAVRTNSAVASARQTLARVEAEAELARRELEELGIEDPSALALKEPQLAEARASLAAAEAQAADANLQLRRTGVYAPFDGLILENSVDVGQYVSPGRSLGRVFATDVIEIELPIPNEELGDIGLPIAFNASETNPGPKVTLRANVGGFDRAWIGNVARTGAQVDPGTRLVSVIAEVRDPFGEGADGDAPLAPGLFVTATIEGRQVDDVFVAPRAALRGLDAIYVVEEVEASTLDDGEGETGSDTAEDANYNDQNGESSEPEMAEVLRIREVEVIRSDRNFVYVRSGLSAGELVITSPVQAAFDGQRVRTFETSETDTEGAGIPMAASNQIANGAN